MTTASRASLRDLARSSWTFHRDLERPGVFLRREWRIVVLACGGYTALMLSILLSIDRAFFYARIETDHLLYLLKAKSLVEHGHTAAVTAVNMPPFPYAAMPGVLRAPFLLIFPEFDDQLLGIQITNVVMIAATALMSGYILSWVLPRQFHAYAVVAPFVFVLLSPDWLANTFVPLADAPFAFLTLACLLLAAFVLASPGRLGEHKTAIFVFTVLWGTAFMVRFTAPALLVAVALLAAGRWSSKSISWRDAARVSALPLAVLAALVALNAQAIFGKYAGEPFYYLMTADKTAMGINLFGSAIPSQIIPVFNLGFTIKPTTNPWSPIFGTTTRDALWTAAGFVISGVTAIGLVRSARRILPEAGYLLATLPVLGMMIPSTTRYLMSFQPIFWLMFVTGAGFLTRPLHRHLHGARGRVVALTGSAFLVGAIVMMRSARTSSTASGAVAGSFLTRTAQYTQDVSQTFRGLRTFLETLPADRTLLISSGGEVGRWSVIAQRDSYAPDSQLSAVVRDKQVYSVLSCGSDAACRSFDELGEARRTRLSRFGEFTYEKVFERATPNARATVHRVRAGGDARPAQPAAGLTSR